MKSKKYLTRNIIFIVIIAIFAWYVFNHHSELNKFLNALSQGSWRWLIVALLAQIGFYAAFTLLTQATFRAVHLERKFKDLVPLVLGSLFVNVLAPTGGQTGTILYADDAARRNESPPKAIIANVLTTIISYTAFSIILVFSLFYLKSLSLLNNYEVTGAIIFVFPIVIPVFFIFSSVKYPDLTVKILDWIRSITIKVTSLFKRPAKISKDWAKSVASELAEATTLAIQNRRRLVRSYFYAFLAHALNIVCLLIIFEAFEVNIHYGALIAGYAFGEVVRIISPQPEGVGVVEVVMAVIFSSFGVPLISATAIVIVFRGLNFWIPLGLGFISVRTLPSFRKKESD